MIQSYVFKVEIKEAMKKGERDKRSLRNRRTGSEKEAEYILYSLCFMTNTNCIKCTNKCKLYIHYVSSV